MENPFKSHRNTIIFPSLFSIRVPVCSCSLLPVLPSLLSIDLMGSPVDCLGGFSQHPMGLGCAGHLHHHQRDTTQSILYSSRQLILFFLSFFITLPTIHLLTMFSSLVPFLPHANLNTVFPTPLRRQTQCILVPLMQLPRYKHPCTPKLSPNFSVHAA